MLVVGLTAWSVPISAHSMYQSAVLLNLQDNAVRAELQLPVDRLSISFRQTVDESHFAGERSKLESYVLQHVHPVTSDGKPFSVRCEGMKIQTVENAPYLVVQLLFLPPPKANLDLWTLNYDVITHEIVTHVVLVSVCSDSKANIPLHDPFLLGMLRGASKSIEVDRMRIL